MRTNTLNSSGAPKTAQPLAKRSTLITTGQQIFDSMVAEFATNAFVTKDDTMGLDLNVSYYSPKPYNPCAE